MPVRRQPACADTSDRDDAARSAIEALLRAPPDRPAAALVSAGGQRRQGLAVGWSQLGEPFDEIVLHPGDFASDEPPADTLRRSLGARAARAPLVGWLSYDLGALLEPAGRAAHAKPLDPAAPVARFASLAPLTDATLASDPPTPNLRYALKPLASLTGAPAYQAAVARAVQLIHAGDVFQVNLAHQLQGAFRGSTRRLFADLVQATAPAFAAYIESPADPSQVILSLSPELFLAVDGSSGGVETRPIKGTLPADQPPDRLAASPKDAAELTMIVDLMRNDLGRVCAPGAIRVQAPRAIERVGGVAPGAGVWHGVATIQGSLAPGRDVFDLLTAAFPPGSITGAPKVRAMQRIDELEPFQRGPCFGAIGTLDSEGGGVFNVAIRTAVVQGEAAAGRFGEVAGSLELCVGAGIVADSDPAPEWRETLAKAQAFMLLADGQSATWTRRPPVASAAGAAT